MRVWPGLLLVTSGCGYSSYWPQTPYGIDTGDGGTYYLDGTPPCSSPDNQQAVELQVYNSAEVVLRLSYVDPVTCGETLVADIAAQGSWLGIQTSNLVFVVRGLDGGLVAYFTIPDGTPTFATVVP
jgi:hypothetical protein